MKLKFILLPITLLFLSCSKELNISEFSDDFAGYESELRIEAIILPTESTALVRIDRSILINDSQLYNCDDDNGNWDPLIDDVGSDGVDSVEEGIPVDSDGSEGNGQPDCGEPNVDEYDEILDKIHVDGCNVSISLNDDTCILEYRDDGGNFYYRNNKGIPTIDDMEYVDYGAYRPKMSDSTCDSFFGNDDDDENEYYTLEVTDCPGYSSIISSSEPITISKPVVFYNIIDHETLKSCDNQTCLESYSILLENDTLYFANNSTSVFLNYVSLLESSYYQVSQWLFDVNSNIEGGGFVFHHEHPNQATDVEGIFENVCLMSEKIFPEIIDDINIFKFEIFTFNESFTNYYFFDMLDIRDPVRTNLRDENGNPIMGTFGAMASNEIILKIIDCSQFETEEDCSGFDAHQVCEWNTNITKCGFKVSPPPQP